MLTILEFRSSETTLYGRYRRLREDVFSRECGWELSNGQTESDRVDTCSDFYGAFDEHDHCIGILRSTSTKYAFPHRNLFQDLLQKPCLEGLWANSVILTNLAVHRCYRGIALRWEGENCPRTAAKALIEAVKSKSSSRGVPFVVATAVVGRSTGAFLSCGFSILGAPFKVPSFPVQTVNLGLLVEKTKGRDAVEYISQTHAEYEQRTRSEPT